MATSKTYPSLTANEAAELIPNGAMVAVSGQLSERIAESDVRGVLTWVELDGPLQVPDGFTIFAGTVQIPPVGGFNIG